MKLVCFGFQFIFFVFLKKSVFKYSDHKKNNFLGWKNNGELIFVELRRIGSLFFFFELGLEVGQQ